MSPAVPDGPEHGLLRSLGRWHYAAAAWLVVLALWLAAATGRDANAWIGRAAVVIAAGALALYVLGKLQGLWLVGRHGRLLLLLLAASALLHFVGLDHDIAHGYFKDEGTYRKAAQEINQGLLLRPWFIYPHLLFYLDAIAFWIAELFEPLVSGLARVCYGIENREQIQVLVGRHVTATLGALTVLPAFAIANRLGGTAAAALGGGLAVLSPLYLQVAHLNISDVPAAFFATLALAAVAALLDGERAGTYAWAGLWAGLAAASKYPAGVVAISILAISLRWSLAKRHFPTGLLIAGLVALGAFVAATPSLLAFPDQVFRGTGPDVMFGARQYAGTGWTGVVHTSNASYYLGLLRHGLGSPALVLGLLGLALLPSTVRGRVFWLLPFPVLYLGLILRMNVAVMRNLMPVLPALAALAGVGLAALLLRDGRPRPPWRRVVIVAGVILCLGGPWYRTLRESIRLARDSTRDVAAAWVHSHLPQGSQFVQEFYTPSLGNRWRYPFWRKRFVTYFTPDELRHPSNDFVFLASHAYLRFLRPGGLVRAPWDEAMAERYREIFETFELVKEFRPGPWRAGPTLRIYEVDPEPLVFVDHAAFSAGDALVSNRNMLPGDDGAILHRRLDRQWSLFKAFLAAGRYRVAIDANLAAKPGCLRVANRENAEIDRQEIVARKTLEVELPVDDKYFFYVHLPAGTRLKGLSVDRTSRRPAGGGGVEG